MTLTIIFQTYLIVNVKTGSSPDKAPDTLPKTPEEQDSVV